jgi:signal recognition particle receptor subunit beta
MNNVTDTTTQFANTTPTPTHTSQTPTTALCKLSPTARSAADRYRSENDTSERDLPTFRLVDTPGHGKLRHHAYTHLTNSSASASSNSNSNTDPTPKGILFVLDSAAPTLSDAAAYLHDILLALQRRRTSAKTSKLPAAIPVLIAANKQDVFTALPAPVVRQRLQEEIGKIRASRSRGLLDSAAQGDDGGVGGGEEDDEESGWLGEYGSERFVFEQVIEFGVEVTVAGGNVLADGDDEDGGRRVQEWWDWIAENL